MREVATLRAHVEGAADGIAQVVARIYDGLEQLAACATVLFQELDPDPEVVEAWARDELMVDPDGYLARRAVLEAAMAGNIDPSQCLFYVHERHATNPEVLRRMYQLRNLGPRIQRLHGRIGGLEWIYYQNPIGWALSYPMHDPHGGIPADFDWLDYFTFKSVEPAANPERSIRWTPPNIDYAGKGLMISPSIPIYLDDGTFAGVWSMDLPIARLLEGVELELEVPGQDTFIVDERGLLVAHRRIATVIGEPGSFSRESIAALGGDFRDYDVSQFFAEPAGTCELRAEDGTTLVCTHRRIEGLGWAVVMTCPARDLFETLRSSVQQAFDRLGGGDLGYRIEQDLGGEGQLLIDAYNEMAEALQRSLEEREREQQVMQHNQRLQAIGQLSGGIAHDLNNLLTAMLGAASLIEPRPDDEELVDDIKIAVERATAMTTQLLAFGRGSIVQPRPIDLAELCRELERLLRRLLPEGIQLHVEAPRESATITADPNQVLQILLNLVVNARDAIGPRGAITIAITQEGDDVVLSVVDDGVGVPDAIIDRVFEPFFTTKATGTGLGLATVREIVESLGGTIRLESLPAGGTRVAAHFPTSDDRPEVRRPASSEHDLAGTRVFVVDDDSLVLRGTVRALEKLGCEVAGHSVAEEALGQLAQGSWDVLLTDVVMPGLNGLELAQRARTLLPGLRVLFMSGYADDALILHGLEQARERLLRKPFTPRALAAVMARALDREQPAPPEAAPPISSAANDEST